MEDLLENAKLYLKIKKEMGFMGLNNVQIRPSKIKELSQFFSIKTRLSYVDNFELTYRFYYSLHIDGVDFIAVSDEVEAWEQGLILDDFKRGAEVWG